jgi:DNA-binding NarL/FixJ family response regulator
MIRTKPRQSKEDSQFFTPRERAILNLMAEGYKNKEIANVLYMSEKTVIENLIHLMRKLNAPSVSSIIVYALEKGLINFYEVLESRFSKRKTETN